MGVADTRMGALRRAGIFGGSVGWLFPLHLEKHLTQSRRFSPWFVVVVLFWGG